MTSNSLGQTAVEIQTVAQEVFDSGTFENFISDLRALFCFLEDHMPAFGRISPDIRQGIMGGNTRYEINSAAAGSALDRIESRLANKPAWRARLLRGHRSALKAVKSYGVIIGERQFVLPADKVIAERALRLCNNLGIRKGFPVHRQHPNLAATLAELEAHGFHIPHTKPQRPRNQPEPRSAAKRSAPKT